MQSSVIEPSKAWRRLLDFGFRLAHERQNIVRDLQRLSEKFDMCCTNHAKALKYTTQLEEVRQSLLEQIHGVGSNSSEHRQLEIELWEVEDLIRIHRGKGRLYLQAATRIYSILRMNDVFLELVSELHQQVQPTLQASLGLLQFYSSPNATHSRPPNFLLAEFNRATGRLAYPYRVYQEWIERSSNCDEE